MNKDKKHKILEWLKEFKRLPTYKISSLVGTTAEYAKKYLEELESEGKVIKEEETNATYWRCLE